MLLDRASNEAELEGEKIKSHSITFDWRLNEVLFAHNTVTDPASNSRKCGEILKQQIKMRQSLLMQETGNKRNDDTKEIGWLLYCFWSFTPDVRMVRLRRVRVCAQTRVTSGSEEMICPLALRHFTTDWPIKRWCWLRYDFGGIESVVSFSSSFRLGFQGGCFLRGVSMTVIMRFASERLHVRDREKS